MFIIIIFLSENVIACSKDASCAAKARRSGNESLMSASGVRFKIRDSPFLKRSEGEIHKLAKCRVDKKCKFMSCQFRFNF